MIRQLENKLSKAPEGSIRFIQRNGNIQYYLRMTPQEVSGRYVRKSEKAVLRTYLQKKYEKKALELLRQEELILLQLQGEFPKQCQKKLQNAGSKTHWEKLQKEDFETCRKQLQDLYSNQPEEVKKFLNPIDMSDEDYANMWLSIPYKKKPIPEEKKTYETDNKEIVRSKSELHIANALFKYGIPYKYECPLVLKGGSVIHPDFTVLNTRTRKIFYWEHRGMMDDRSYVQDSVKRIKDYTKSGIVIGKELIITEETLMSPLSTYEIHAIIMNYFQ